MQVRKKLESILYQRCSQVVRNVSVGKLSNDDGNASEKANLKYKFMLFELYHDYPKSSNLYSVRKFHVSSKNKIDTAFKLRTRMKHPPSCTHVLHKKLNLVMHVAVSQRMAENVRNCITRVQSDCFCSVHLLFCGVFFTVSVVVASVPCSGKHTLAVRVPTTVSRSVKECHKNHFQVDYK